jgi:hypothetical protein
MSASNEDLEKALERLEAERRGRSLGFVGAAAAVVGDWVQWLWMPEIQRVTMASVPKAGQTKPAYTTTYSRATPKKDDTQSDLSEPTEWRHIWVTTENASARSPGAIEEAQFRTVGDEVVVADLDERIMATRPLGPNEDAAVVARRLLRERVSRWPAIP